MRKKGIANLRPGELKIMQLKQKLAFRLRRRRENLGFTQVALARRLGVSQGRLAQIESAGSIHTDRNVTIDVLMLLEGAVEELSR